MEFDEHEDQEEEMGIPVAPPGYDTFCNSGRSTSKMRTGVTGGGGDGTGSAPPNTARNGEPSSPVRYRECLKNHAVSIGGHAVDGCCEFMPAGEETLDALKCAACGCHRNFHRKQTTDGDQIATSYQHQHHHHQFSPYYRAPPPPAAGYLHHHHLITPVIAPYRPLALPAAASGGGHIREEEDMSNPSSSGGGGGSGSGRGTKKRFRTKFSQEQKEKMLAFAESVGWRIQKHDEGAVEQFCEENGVQRNVLKVWMHNNKHTLGGKLLAIL